MDCECNLTVINWTRSALNVFLFLFIQEGRHELEYGDTKDIGNMAVIFNWVDQIDDSLLFYCRYI